MFFRKAGKYLGVLYFFYFSVFVVLYFSLFEEYGFAEETYSFHAVFSGFKQISGFLAPIIILLYIVTMITVVKFLVNYFEKRESIAFYFYYILSSVFGILFYLLFWAVVYFPFKKFILRLKAVSLTEIPLLIAYVSMAVIVLFFWKLVTYWKIKSRLNYFGKFSSYKFLILPLNGISFSSFLKFFAFVFIVVGLPFFLFLLGILNKGTVFITVSVILSYIFFPFSKLYVYYLLIDKKEI